MADDTDVLKRVAAAVEQSDLSDEDVEELALKSGTVPADAEAVKSVAVPWEPSTDKPQLSTSEPAGRAK